LGCNEKGGKGSWLLALGDSTLRWAASFDGRGGGAREGGGEVCNLPRGLGKGLSSKGGRPASPTRLGPTRLDPITADKMKARCMSLSGLNPARSCPRATTQGSITGGGRAPYHSAVMPCRCSAAGAGAGRVTARPGRVFAKKGADRGGDRTALRMHSKTCVA